MSQREAASTASRPGIAKAVSKMSQKCPKNVSKMFQKCFKNVSKMYQKCFKNISKKS